MRIIVAISLILLFVLTACGNENIPPLPTAIPQAVGTAAAQAPTAAAGIGGAINAAQTEAAQMQTLAAPAETLAAGAFSTAAPLAQTAVAAAQTAVTTAVAPLGSITPPAGAAAVQVKLTDNKIDMPVSLHTGVVLFVVTNAGTTEHNFEIQGANGDKKLAANLRPGETAPLTIDLGPGNYKVFDPVGSNRDQGLTLNVTVTAQ